jgi:glycopeptide antibiotics resistance protein
MVVFCGIIYISILPDPPHPDDVSKYLGGIPLNDKVGHLVMFFGLGFLISNFLDKMFKCMGLKNVVWAIGLSLFVGIIHEIDQYLTGRGYEIDDLYFDLLGGFLGALVFNILFRINQRLSKKSVERKLAV